MKADLQAAILKALEGSSSQKPVELDVLYRLGSQEAVQAVLTGLYNARRAQTCLVTRRSAQKSLWWEVGNVRSADEWLRPTKPQGEPACAE